MSTFIPSEFESTDRSTAWDGLFSCMSDEQHLDFVEQYRSEVDLRDELKVLEIGAGSGAVSQRILGWPGVTCVEGVDNDVQLHEHALARYEDIEGLRFTKADARKLPHPVATFDLVVFHCSLAHIPEPEKAVAEAFRVLEPGGQILIFEGDFGALSFANSYLDLFEFIGKFTASQAALDPWLVRRIPELLARQGFGVERERAFAYTARGTCEYLLGLLDRGVDQMLKQRAIGPVLAEALKGEARRRIAVGDFHASIPYLCFSARKPQADVGGGI